MQVSELKLSRFSFKSSLRRFSTRRQEAMGDRLISGGVLVDETDSVKWSVQLYPNGFNTACSDHLSLFAAFQSNNKSLTLSKRVEFSIIDARGQKRNRVSFEDTFSPNFGRGFGKFVSRKRLRSQADQLLPNDTLTICCQVEDVLPEATESQSKRARLQLSEDLRSCVNDATFSDVSFQVGERTVPAHKVVLASRSPVFAAMFRPDSTMRESATNRVVIEDIDADVFVEFLHFVYTGEAPRIDDMAAALLVAADKYDVSDLKDLCGQVLAAQLSVEDCVSTLILADVHSAEPLRRAAIDFIVRRAAVVVDTSGWKALTRHPNLINDVFVLLAKSSLIKSDPRG